MAATKRTPFQINKDRALIAHLYSRGKRQDEIARILSEDQERGYTLTRQSVTRDIKIIQEGWLRASVASIGEVRARTLITLDEMEREAWEAFERSKAVKTKRKAQTRTTAATTPGAPADPVSQTAERLDEDQNGDPRWFELMLKVVDRRCKMLGLDAPVKVDYQDVSKRIPWKELTNDQIERIRNRESLQSVIPGFVLN